jgi:aryl-alcohol dehydrogenase-like predicted oxidoreductase
MVCRYGPKVNAAEAVEGYRGIADDLGIPLLALSLRWLVHQASISSVVLGASNSDQLLKQMEAVQQGPLDTKSLAAIDIVHTRYPNPCP